MTKKITLVVVLAVIAGLGVYLIQVFLKNSQKDLKKKGTEKIVREFTDEQNNPNFFIKPNDVVLEKIFPGRSLMIEKVALENPGFVVVYKEREAKPQNIIGYSYLLPKGESRNVYISLKDEIKVGQIIFIGLRFDDGDGFFEYSGKYDKNLSRADGKVIFWEAEVKN